MPGHFSSMARSVFDFSLYREVGPQRASRTTGYFALLVLLSSLCITTGITLELRGLVHKHVLPEVRSWPIITIKDHQASANVPQPWMRSFEDKDGTAFLLVVDTTGRTTGFAPKEYGLLLTRTQLITRESNHPDTRTFDLASVDDRVLDPVALTEQFLSWGLWAICGALMVMLPIYFTAAKLVHALLLSLVALLATAGRRRTPSYGALFTVSIYALTPTVALDVIVSVANLDVPHFWLIYLAIGCVYAAVAARHLPDESTTVSASPSAPPPPSDLPPGSIS